MRVATWNLWWKFGDWQARQKPILETLRGVDADVVCLQEVFDDEPGPGARSQHLELAESLGRYAAFGSRISWGGAFAGNAILSRWPIVGYETRPLPGRPGDDMMNVALVAEIAAPEGTAHVIATHLEFRWTHGAVRVGQANELLRITSELPAGGYPTVLCGDLNATPDSDEIRMLKGRHTGEIERVCYLDAWDYEPLGSPGFTWSRANPQTSAGPNQRIDFVLVQAPIAMLTHEPSNPRIFGADAVDCVVPSDHYGVVADIISAQPVQD